MATMRSGRSATFALVIATSLTATSASPAAAGVARLRDNILNPRARGAITFANTANVASFQQDGILTHKGWQYVTWYRGDRRAVISRRRLPAGRWASVALAYTLHSDDSHNAPSMVVTPTDGRIHIAFPTHADAIRYMRSEPGVADRPGRVQWSSKRLEPTRSKLPGAPEAPPTFTYPQFERVGDDTLLTWRQGGSQNGHQVLLRYDENRAGTWSYEGRFTTGAGMWSSAYGTSTSRYGYPHGFTHNRRTGNLEMTFSWREQTSAWCSPNGLGNHDLGYVASPDGGRTWRNSDGQTIGRTGTSDQISISDPHVVVPISINRGLMNSETQAVDGDGRLHVVTSMISDADLLLTLLGCHTATYGQRARYARPYHHWRGADGTWHTAELPYYSGGSGRAKLVFASDETAYVVLPDARIVAATARNHWADWRTVFAARDVTNVGELIVDRQRVRREGILTVVYQEPGYPAGAPSAFRVADFELGSREGHRLKSTAAEAAPEPHARGVISRSAP
jgi:hypothetical protein